MRGRPLRSEPRRRLVEEDVGISRIRLKRRQACNLIQKLGENRTAIALNCPKLGKFPPPTKRSALSKWCIATHRLSNKGWRLAGEISTGDSGSDGESVLRSTLQQHFSSAFNIAFTTSCRCRMRCASRKGPVYRQSLSFLLYACFCLSISLEIKAYWASFCLE